MDRVLPRFLMFLIIGFPMLALAADGGLDAGVAVVPVVVENGMVWWQVLLSHVMELAFAVVGIMVSAFITVLLKKYGFESQTTKINDVLDRAIGWAEQKSKKAAKFDGKPIDSGAKMDLAIEFAEKLAKEYKIADKGVGWWEGKLESWLSVKDK